jgi:nicotinamidase/pyrazinamidase
MAEKRIIFWDVDTQFDFMNPQGRLYVPGADSIVDNVSEVRRLALENGYCIIASVDWHSLEDEEISLTPNNKSTFAPHCLAFEPGSERVGYLGQVPVDFVELERMNETELAGLVERDQFHLVIRTNSVNVFENPNTVTLLDLVRPRRVVVFGVALDVCVYHAVSGLLAWGRSEISVLEDAVKGLGIKKDEEVYEEFRRQGVRMTRVGELTKEL